ALQLLKTKAAEEYQMVTKYIGVIECVTSGSGMQAWNNPPRFQIGKLSMGNPVWEAGAIVHDSFHSKLYHDYLDNNPDITTVPDEIWTGEVAETRCLDVQVQALQKLGAEQWLIDGAKKTLETKWWLTPHEKTWW
ncbi:MAG: hypothetical protein Q7R95_05480, partial [bacterium]|nr:hypothetical protein [bacterium]